MAFNTKETFAVISDVHANRQALDAVLETMDKLAIKQLVCLGDSVGYGGEPAQCLERLREISSVMIQGNHDLAAAMPAASANFNSYAKSSAEITASLLSGQDKEYLLSLESIEKHDEICLVHGAISEPEKYIKDAYSADAELRLLPSKGARLLLCGHTHVPAAAELGGFNEVKCRGSRLSIRIPNEPFVINPGSVGQPRDGDRRASFCIVYPENGEIEFRRVEYDIDSAAKTILERGLPEILANRLFYAQ